MTPGLGFAFLAMICFGAGDLVYKRAAAVGIDSRHFVMLQSWVFCPAVTIYAWLSGTLELHLAALWGALAGLFSVVAFYNFARSLQGGAVSTNAPIFRLNFAVTAALAIAWLGETLTLPKLGALACAVVAVWLLLAAPAGQSARPSLGALTRVIVAMLALAFANLFYKIGLLHGALPETILFAQAVAFSSTATLFAWLRERRFGGTPGAWPYAAAAALLLLAGFVLLLHGLAAGPASVLVPVAQLGFVFTALLGAVIFREKLTPRKCAGLAVAAASLALFAMS